MNNIINFLIVLIFGPPKGSEDTREGDDSGSAGTLIDIFGPEPQGESMATEHFKDWEFRCKTKPPTPVPENLKANLYRLQQQLEIIRQTVGVPISIMSGYRTPEYNARPDIGGAEKSEHLYALAADIQAPGVDPVTLHQIVLSLIKQKAIPDGGVGLYQRTPASKGWVHYDLGKPNRRWYK